MKQIAVDDETYALAQRWATRKGLTIPEAISDALRAEAGAPLDSLATIGCMDDDAEFLDGLVEEAMRERQIRPMRLAEVDLGNG